ncbi:hypothetical protein SAMN05428950_101240 [Sphingomonas sp. OV641]|uniref:hypothetical protein n=1 Tax=Sphingomonas sp. OV641 TaxID=1881068 RepID=UPI0008BABC2B|nr:hypothetical protein [Sphingomonas sp. OV641]SEI79286.1 hypothetical protein SAMN05428950_101240 [Sphingomonas sp. OV641]
MTQTDHLASHLHTAVAEELRHVRVLLEQLSMLLVADEHFALHHLEKMQMFDLLIQCTDESAAVLDRMAAGAKSHDAIEPVRLEVVQDRLRAALAKAA